jgi:fimbrial chaperone protein
VQAGAFTVVPVRLYFGPRDRAVAVTLANTGSTPIALQAELYSWSQKADGSDVLEPTDDLILAPPLIRLAPGTQQVVRLALLRPADLGRQLSYRMIVRELPDLEATRRDAVTVPVTLALNLPVFITPPVAHSQVTCATQRAGATVQAVCENKGNAYALLREIVLKRGGTELARFEGGAYVLPGVKRTVALATKGPVEPGAAQLFLSFDDNQQVLAEELVP